MRRICFEADGIPVAVQNVSLKKIINWVLTEASVFFKPSRPWGFPTLIQVEPSNHCNLRCPFCPVTLGMGRELGHMKLDMFKEIIDQLRDYLLLILFWDWGEPFLNPNAYEMIHYACQCGIKVISSTNGHVFASGDHARKVVQSGLDALIFSVDGITEEAYRRYRDQGRLETVLEGIRKVVAEKKRLKVKRPIVNLRYIVMRHNERDIGALREFARSLGVDMLVLRRYHTAHSGHQSSAGWESQYAPSEVKYRIPAYSDEDGQPVRISRNPCRNLWNCPTIHWDGTVCSCFADSCEKHPLGFLARQQFGDIWNGADFQDLRREFRNHWQELPLCGICTYGFEKGDIGQDSNAEVEWLIRHKCT
ncbi:MAG: radical SAM protein [Syntrophobacteraceae bacterium]